MNEKQDSEHEKVWDDVQISEEKTDQPLTDFNINTIQQQAKDQAAKLMDLSRQYMESVIDELDLDREKFYEGVGQGLNLILSVTAKFLQDKKQQ